MRIKLITFVLLLLLLRFLAAYPIAEWFSNRNVNRRTSKLWNSEGLVGDIHQLSPHIRPAKLIRDKDGLKLLSCLWLESVTLRLVYMSGSKPKLFDQNGNLFVFSHGKNTYRLSKGQNVRT